MNENKKIILSSSLSILLIVTLAVIGKATELARMINISNAIIIFPLTFIITGYVVDTLGSKWARKNIYSSAWMVILFLLSLVLVSFFRSNDPTYYYRASLEFVFTPKNTSIFGLAFCYPDLIKTGLFIGGFVASHLIFISLYKAVKDYTPRGVSFLLSYLISYIVNVIIVFGLDGVISLLKKTIEFNPFIQLLTSNFIGAILSCVIATIIYSIMCLLFKPKEKIQIKNIS